MSGSVLGQIGVGRGAGLALERAGAGVEAARLPGSGTFREVLGRTRGASDDAASREAREAAEGLVAGALVRPVLARMRASNDAAPPFAPGLWEKTFAPLLDEAMATRIVRSSRWSLVDRLAEGLAARSRGLRGGEESGDG